MAKKTVKVKFSQRGPKKTLADYQQAEAFSANSSSTSIGLNSPRNRFRIFLICLVILLVIGAWLYRNKQLFLVAIVNGKPVMRSELTDILMKRYGTQTLDNLVNERLVTDEVRKQNVVVSDAELQSRIDELTKTLPKGTKISDALAAQGISEEQFRNQLKLQLAVDKLLDQEVSVSASEIDTYIKQNKQTLPATSEAELRRQAETDLRKQKVEELFQGWFASLKEKASIQRFL